MAMFDMKNLKKLASWPTRWNDRLRRTEMATPFPRTSRGGAGCCRGPRVQGRQKE
jgi:hypothetical protein